MTWPRRTLGIILICAPFAVVFGYVLPPEFGECFIVLAGAIATSLCIVFGLLLIVWQ